MVRAQELFLNILKQDTKLTRGQWAGFGPHRYPLPTAEIILCNLGYYSFLLSRYDKDHGFVHPWISPFRSIALFQGDFSNLLEEYQDE